MKKIFLLLLLIVSLTACSTATDIGEDMPRADNNGSAMEGIDRPVAESFDPDALQTGVSADESDRIAVNGVIVSEMTSDDTSKNFHIECSDPESLDEFLLLIQNQRYSKIDKLSYVTHKVKLCDSNGELILSLEVGYNEIAIDHSVTIGNVTLEKGAYEAADVPWASFSYFLDHLWSGYVAEPSNIKCPASVKISGEFFRAYLVDKGSRRLNKYEVCPMMYDFVETCFAGREFVITSVQKYYDHEGFQAKKDKIAEESRCIQVEFYADAARHEIMSQNTYSSFSRANSAVLAREEHGKPSEYVLLTDEMIFRIKADETFDKRFDELFTENSSVIKQTVPTEIEELFNDNKPYYMEYVYSSLEIDEWTGSEPDRLEIKEMKLGSNGNTYTVVHFYNPYDLRMLVYNQNSNGSLSYVGNIDFGGRGAGTDYNLVDMGDNVWISGMSCKGWGTGILLNFSDWYHVTRDGVSLALSYPSDAHEYGPYGGYSVVAEKVNMSETKGVSVEIDYETAKSYNIFLDISDEYGSVELKGKKKVVFIWDDDAGRFVLADRNDAAGIDSAGDMAAKAGAADTDNADDAAAVNTAGIYYVNADCLEITKQCDALLVEYFGQLEENIVSLSQESNDRNYKARGVKAFLQDCSDCAQKKALLTKLTELCPDI